MAAKTLRLSGMLIVASILLLLSAELFVELGQIMLRHWQDEQQEMNKGWMQEDLKTLETCSSEEKGLDPNMSNLNGSSNANVNVNGTAEVDSSMKLVSSFCGAGMKRSTSGMSMTSMHSSSAAEYDSSMKKIGSVGSMKKIGSVGSMKRVASGNSITDIRKAVSSGNNLMGMVTNVPGDNKHPQFILIDISN